MNKNFIIIMALGMLTGCRQEYNSVQLEELSKEVSSLQSQLESVIQEKIDLTHENIRLKNLFDGYEYEDKISFKDRVQLKAKVLEKKEGDDLYPYYIIVTMEDRDHNTPLLVTLNDEEMYKNLQVDKEYDLDVFVTSIVDKDNGVIRFMYMLLENTD